MTNDFNMPVTPHRLELMDRAHLTVSGVEDVERFDESGVIMTTSAGTLIVTGEDLHIGKLSLEGGELYVDGRITSISYEDTPNRQGGFLQPSVRDRPWPSHVTEQLRTFLLSILLGLGAGVLYDLLRAVRLRHPRLTAPLDLLYCQAIGLAVFLFVLPQLWMASSGGSSCWEVWARRSVFFPALTAPAAGLGLLAGPVDGIVPISESTGTVLRRSL